MIKQASQIVNAMGFREKFKSPQYRSFSKDIRETKGGCCHACKCSDRPLEVRHIFYDPTREPWEYSSEEMVLLCDGCHKELQEHLQNFRKLVFGKLTPASMRVLNGALTVALDYSDPLLLTHAIAEFVCDPGRVERFAASFNPK